ncbi:tRNA/rRNA methyltransferase (SpoU) [Syntrophobotulus glycolicus DSM 8271]|uniref:tRNA/rRNA methyltransferase (SpoU) n=1 Tax=Syntrophobotulus glycolicus (strain DSM 8271 / FlGlyR) TaxID=645991 RepID=F0SWS9_SYNGF|nr:RNA methyltransferase [Syntrophobotulus glycolicus]ADY54619.1 tRNA/rRNA methyltransferase (SpoU) [Syntrophobotulus glycolicus DSM 8271]
MITSVRNEQVKHIVSLHQTKGRKTSQQFFAEGRRFVGEALMRSKRIEKIFYCPAKGSTWEREKLEELILEAGKLRIPAEEVSEDVMKRISATEEPQGILALINQEEYSWDDIQIEPDTILLILDGIRDPGNLGTILRASLAAGVKNVVLTRGTVDYYNPKVLRSSMGAVFSMCILQEIERPDIWAFCRQNHLNLVVSALEGQSVYRQKMDQSLPLALVIGSEANGVAPEFSEISPKKIMIPMQNNVESLNAALAAGILLFEIRRQADFLKNTK